MKGALFGAWRLLAGLARPSRRRNVRGLDSRGESLSSMKIREAMAADIPALARLHVITWNATYVPFLMKGPSYEVRERQWREAFARNDPGWFCFVERSDGELVGFAQGNKSDHNVTLDGCCDHRAIIPDEHLHRHAAEHGVAVGGLPLR